MQMAYIILLSFCFISVVSAINDTNHTTNVLNTTVEPNTDVIPATNVLWSRLENYTCKDLIPAINIFYNISQSECESRCLSFFNNSMQCTAAVWYEYIKPIGNDVPRCYLFGQSCELVVDFVKPVTTSFWYYNITEKLNCVNYPNNWKDLWFDDCDAYSLFNFCDYAYNSSTTAILSYQDTIYGFDALQVCCGCNGGLYNYNNRFLFEPKWKPTAILNIYDDSTDFICEAVDIAATTALLVDEVGILDKHKFNFTQFVGLCQHLHASLYDKYKLLLSISAENNDIMNAKNIDSDFNKFKQFDCVNNLLLNEVTICNNTDENNLYPFIIDLEEDHIYINNHYINSETFIYHLPPTHIHIQSFCSFSMLLNTTFPTKPPTKEPTFEPTMEPTIVPTNVPTTNPTQITSNPTSLPTNVPTYEPTFEPTQTRRRLISDYDSQMYFKTNIIAAFLCEIDYTRRPTSNPTISPTMPPIHTTEAVITDIISNVTLDIKQTESEKNESMSTGAITAIIGSVVGVLFFCIMTWTALYYFNRNKWKQNGINEASPPGMAVNGMEMARNDDGINLNSTTSKQTTKKKKKRFVTKSVSKWNNDDILDWIGSLGLSESWQQIASEAIQKCKCNGKDIVKLQSKKEVNDLFGLDNPMLNGRLWKEIKIKIQTN